MKQIFNLPIIVIVSFILSAFSCHADNKSIKEQIGQTIQNITENIDSIDSSTVILERKSDEYYKYKKEELIQENMVAIYAIIFIFGIPSLVFILITIFVILYLYKKRTARYRIIDKALDKGIELPESFFNETTLPAQKSRLQSALIWIGCGFGIMCFFCCLCDVESGIAFGVIPFFVGIAKLITYFVEDRKKADKDAK